MKVLIGYCSKTGVTEEAAKYINKKIENSKIINLSKHGVDLKEYDKIILGSGTYFGKIHKDLQNFIEDNKATLLKKKFAIFYTCSHKDEKKQTAVKSKCFDPQLSSKAMAISCVGGKYNTGKGNIISRFMVSYLKMKNNIKKENQPELDFTKIDDFIEIIKSVSVENKN